MVGDVVVTGASVLSPQHAMTAVAAQAAGKQSIHYIGATTVEKAMAHPSPRIAAEHGAHFRELSVAYNPNLQRHVQRLADVIAAEILYYGVTPMPGSPPEVLRAFHDLGAQQVRNLPDLDTLVLPLGSGNSAASVLWGIARHLGPVPRQIHLIEIGPSRVEWLGQRLRALGARSLPCEVYFHRTDYAYSDRVRLTVDEITLHPTYEAKVAEWCYAHPEAVPRWGPRGEDCMLWIVGSAL
jgi:hypothetical protein